MPKKDSKEKINFVIPNVGFDDDSKELNLNFDGDPLTDSINKEPDPDDFNFSEFLTDSGIPYDKLYSYSIDKESIGEFIKQLLADTVLIDDYRSALISAFILTPSAIVSTSPILFTYGESGSGKSGIGHIAASLYGVKCYGVLTYAGMRNLIHQKFTNGKRERNFIFVIDDIDSRFLADPNIFSMLKSGCYRQYERIAIAGKEPGEIIEFFCFCPKLFSSQFNLFNDERFVELNRRFVPIPTFKSTKIPHNELGGINFNGIEKKFAAIWKNKDLCSLYAQKLALCNASLPRIADENNISIDQLTILLPQSITAEIFDICSIKEYFEIVKKSWGDTKENIASRSLDESCQNTLKKLTKKIEINGKIHLMIRHQQFVEAIKFLRKKELTDLKMPEIKQVLRNQGWVLRMDGFINDTNCIWVKEFTEEKNNND